MNKDIKEGIMKCMQKMFPVMNIIIEDGVIDKCFCRVVMYNKVKYLVYFVIGVSNLTIKGVVESV